MSRKADARLTALAARRAQPDAEREAADQAILVGAVGLATGCRLVASYLPMRGEPGGADLVDTLSVVAPLILPVLRPDRDLDWVRYDGPARLRRTSGGLREPEGDLLGPDVISTAEVILVPALVVDRAGVRLGRGGGSYDRALARVPDQTLVVALLYDGERVDALPREAHDRLVTAVLSPAGFAPIRMS